ncbi:MAG: 30S ribosomal protein S17 [Candidatus Pacebacteria bacterium]|nr:30S ribosomal protein S17 [Candidatus Paceibacterota bacterium]
MKKEQVTNRKKLTGMVVSDKMDKTVVVNVSRYVAHKKYGKYFKIDKRYKAHDETNEYKVGDKVTIEETRPMSKDKTFKVLSKVTNN